MRLLCLAAAAVSRPVSLGALARGLRRFGWGLGLGPEERQADLADQLWEMDVDGDGLSLAELEREFRHRLQAPADRDLALQDWQQLKDVLHERMNTHGQEAGWRTVVQEANQYAGEYMSSMDMDAECAGQLEWESKQIRRNRKSDGARVKREVLSAASARERRRGMAAPPLRCLSGPDTAAEILRRSQEVVPPDVSLSPRVDPRSRSVLSDQQRGRILTVLGERRHLQRHNV